MEIIEKILKNAFNLLKNYHKENFELKDIYISTIKSSIEGHYCSNILFSLRNKLKPGFEDELKKILLSSKYITKIEFVAGYINLTMSEVFFEKITNQILQENVLPDIGKGEKVNVEYCSINPTGFLHIGHARNAILGDAIANLLKKTNFNVTKEYYVNDAGNQINTLAKSIYAIYCKKHNIEFNFPENGYKSEEIEELASKIKKEDTLETIGQIAMNYFLTEIKKDLEKMKIQYDMWIYESKIIASGYVQKAIQILKDKGNIYEGIRETKQVLKGKENQLPLLLLKTTKFGDDQDRPLTKSDNSWTYLAPDIGYHLNKIERGFNYLICVLGADHDSYAKRIKIATKLLKEDIEHKIIICQMVSFENEGHLVKFSKRAGNIIKVSDFLEHINCDILRFMILEKNPNTNFIFDYDSAISVSMKNPVFYCQYAYARACSILRNFNKTTQNKVENCEAFKITEFKELIVQISIFSDVIKEATKELTPHSIINYIKKTAEKFHQLCQAGKIDRTKLFIIENNETETINRINIAKAFLKIMKEAFEVLGIETKDKL